MSNIEDFEKVTTAMNEAPIALSAEELQNFFRVHDKIFCADSRFA